jgi:hypothetical protein
MDLLVNYRHLIPRRWRKPYKNDPTSVVMLLRIHHFFPKEELQAAAERAWKVSFREGGPNSKHFVAQRGFVTFLKAGPHVMNILHQPRAYGGDDGPPRNADWLPLPSQKQAWMEHRAWASVDYMKRDVDLELAYCVSTKLVAELLDGNCTGIYIPGERMLVPNDQALYLELQKMAGVRDPGIS